MRNWIALGLAGMLGVLARHVAQTVVPRFSGLPWGTFVVNVTGAFAVGLVAGLVAHRLNVPMWIQEALIVGFLGGYTTFSTFSLETVLLMDRGKYVMAAAYSFGTIGAGVAAVMFGGWLGRTA
jgi:CrcB protein